MCDQAAARRRIRLDLQLRDEKVQRVQGLPQVVARGGEKARLVRVGEIKLTAFFLRLVKKPDVLEGDHRLVGKSLQQFLLGIRDRSGLGPADNDRAQRPAVTQHRYAEHAPCPTHGFRESPVVVRVGAHILQADDRLAEQHSAGYL